MTTPPSVNAVRSEKGVALVIVLLLLAVMMGLTTGMTLSGQTDIAMASNELNYAGARAAAEAGLNRAIEQIIADTSTNLLAGADGEVDAGNPLAAANADNGRIPGIGNGPFTIGDRFAYTLQILDDDDPSLYPTALAEAQLTQMAEDGSPYTSLNDRLILRAIGTGPRGTTVSIMRVLQSVATGAIPPTSTTILSNPAILVGGSLDINGNITVGGTEGNIHTNGNVTGGGSEDISGDITATGTVADGLDPAGLKAGGMPPITIPEIKAEDYRNLADWILTSTGERRRASDNALCGGAGPVCPTGWSFSGGAWSSSGAMPSAATYYVEGPVSVHGTGKSVLTSVSIIAEGSITITGNGKFRPENSAKIQFVTNGDFELGGTVDADDSVDLDGQIMVREQMRIYGNSEFQGRVMVENRDGTTNAYDASTNPHGRRGASTTDANTLAGNMRVTYNGNLGDIVTTVETPGSDPTFTNNISGWIEQ
ncbi:MAG: hypothetical protein Q8T13_16895 [Acidobacteriota bacterium]|nr:hypothetical protein [Acidobacteriota bacterium]